MIKSQIRHIFVIRRSIYDMESFGQFIKQQREIRNWTQAEFGAIIEINISAISRIENGSQKFSRSKLKKLSEVFNTDEQEIIDLFFADKFAREAYQNCCSDAIFSVAQETINYIRIQMLNKNKNSILDEKKVFGRKR